MFNDSTIIQFINLHNITMEQLYNTTRKFSDKAVADFRLIDIAVNEKESIAYSNLLDKYKIPVYHLILKMVKNIDDAEDLTIETFSKAFRVLEKFKKEYAFSTWLFKIATNNSIDFLRKKKINTFSINTTLKKGGGNAINIDLEDVNLTPDEKVIKDQKIKLIQKFVGELPIKYGRLIELRYFKEYSYKEIAEATDTPLGTIKTQLSRAKELMYELIKNKKSQL